MLNPEEFFAEVSSRLSLADLVARRTALRRVGPHLRGHCPFCHEQETEGRFHVYEDHFHCFFCGAHGNHVTFLMRTRGIETVTAIQEIASEAGFKVPEQLLRELSTSIPQWEDRVSVQLGSSDQKAAG